MQTGYIGFLWFYFISFLCFVFYFISGHSAFSLLSLRVLGFVIIQNNVISCSVHEFICRAIELFPLPYTKWPQFALPPDYLKSFTSIFSTCSSLVHSRLKPWFDFHLAFLILFLYRLVATSVITLRMCNHLVNLSFSWVYLLSLPFSSSFTLYREYHITTIRHLVHIHSWFRPPITTGLVRLDQKRSTNRFVQTSISRHLESTVNQIADHLVVFF